MSIALGLSRIQKSGPMSGRGLLVETLGHAVNDLVELAGSPPQRSFTRQHGCMYCQGSASCLISVKSIAGQGASEDSVRNVELGRGRKEIN